jgi:lipopolysaccharide export system protein LptA
MIRSAFSLLVALLVTLAAPLRAADAPPSTEITCEGLFETFSTFKDKVVVIGNNLRLYCDILKVVATRKGDPAATIGQYGYFKSLVATGNVRIVQGDREATCGRAEVFPGEDRIVLSEDPVVRSLDDQYVAAGPRLVLYRGQRRAVIEGTTEERVRITLPAIKDLGFEEEKKASENPAPAAPKP